MSLEWDVHSDKPLIATVGEERQGELGIHLQPCRQNREGNSDKSKISMVLMIIREVRIYIMYVSKT